MKNNIFLSIVIPIYNGEKVITRCLNSIWDQGLDENQYEVICVNDCSVDNTVDIITKIRQSHPNLRLLLNSENKRAGGSRNYGVQQAKGDYIVFIDADDYFHHDSLHMISNYLNHTDLDILMCDFARETEFQSNNDIFLNFPYHHIMSGRDFLISNSCPFGPCKYIFKRELMCKNSIYFEEKVCCEDVDWVHKLTLSANRIQYQPILLSHVIINEDSQTANEHKNLRPISEKFFAGYRMYKLSENYYDDSEICSKLQSVSFIYYNQGLKYFTALSSKISEKIAVLKKYLPDGDKDLPKSIKLVQKHPYIYSFITNITAPFVAYAIILKRKIKGR